MEHRTTRAAPFIAMDNTEYRQRGAPFPGIDHTGFGGYRPPFFALDPTRIRLPPAPAAENPSRVTNFSIERILSADLGNSTPAERMVPGTLGLPYSHCVFYPLYPVMPRVIVDTRAYPYDVTCGAGQRSQEEMRAQQQQQQEWKPRVRTVFTDSQLQRLEELFERTRYPDPETRAEVARSIGLSEDTVRIWFKNHRARRKRKRQGSGPQSTQGHL